MNSPQRCVQEKASIFRRRFLPPHTLPWLSLWLSYMVLLAILASWALNLCHNPKSPILYYANIVLSLLLPCLSVCVGWGVQEGALHVWVCRRNNLPCHFLPTHTWSYTCMIFKIFCVINLSCKAWGGVTKDVLFKQRSGAFCVANLKHKAWKQRLLKTES